VTENNGKKTPGVDKEIWDTPEKKIQAVHALRETLIKLSNFHWGSV
jgi:RNA-directed DNA polymerase